MATLRVRSPEKLRKSLEYYRYVRAGYLYGRVPMAMCDMARFLARSHGATSRDIARIDFVLSRQPGAWAVDVRQRSRVIVTMRLRALRRRYRATATKRQRRRSKALKHRWW